MKTDPRIIISIDKQFYSENDEILIHIWFNRVFHSPTASLTILSPTGRTIDSSGLKTDHNITETFAFTCGGPLMFENGYYKIQVTTNIIGAPFDKKGTYILQTIYSEPKLMAHGGGEFELLDDADPETSQGNTHFLSIPEQFNAHIPFSEIVCKQGLELTERSLSAYPLCVKPESKDALIKRGIVHDRSQDPEGLVFDGFDTYSESVPLDFAIWFKGNANTVCFNPKITVTDSTGQGVWSSEDPHASCDTDEPKYLKSTYRLNTIAHDYPILSIGKYTITAQFENYKVSKEITVK